MQPIRLILIAFPFLLILMGAISFIFYFNERGDLGGEGERREEQLELAALLRRDISDESLAGDRQALRAIVQNRSSQAEAAGVMASFLSSSMGRFNMGYEVKDYPSSSPELSKGEAALPTIAAGANLSAKRYILVAADYQSGGQAAELLSLARSLTGGQFKLPLRFMLYYGEEQRQPLLKNLANRGEQAVETIFLQERARDLKSLQALSVELESLANR